MLLGKNSLGFIQYRGFKVFAKLSALDVTGLDGRGMKVNLKTLKGLQFEVEAEPSDKV